MDPWIHGEAPPLQLHHKSIQQQQKQQHQQQLQQQIHGSMDPYLTYLKILLFKILLLLLLKNKKQKN